MRMRSLRALAMGAAVSWARSMGEAYTAATAFSAAIRSAAASAWATPASPRWSPGALPGRVEPVVGV